MTIIQTFPRFHRFLPEEIHALELHAGDVGYIIQMMERIVMPRQNDHEYFQQVCLSLYLDFSEAIQLDPQHAITYQFGKFCVATVAAAVFSSFAISTTTFEWLTASLANEYPAGIQVEYDMAYLIKFLNGETQCDDDFVNEMLWQWASALFYYARHFNALNPLGNFTLQNVISRLRPHPDRLFLYEVHCWCNIQSWAKSQQNSEWKILATRNLLRIFHTPDQHLEKRKYVGIQLSCNDIPELDVRRTEWADRVLTEFNGYLSPLDRLHLIDGKYRGNIEGLVRDIDSILETLQQFRDAHPIDIASIADNYWHDRMYTIIHNLILEAIINGEAVIAQQMILAFFGRNPTDGNISNILHIIPNAPDGICYSVGQTVLLQPQSTLEKLPPLVDALNLFLHATIALRDYEQYQPSAPEEHLIGKPNLAYAGRYYNALANYFDFSATAEIDPKTIGGYYLHSSIQMPIQPVMVDQLGYTFPQMESFSAASPPREMRRILVWRGRSMNPEEECTGVQDILEVSGIQVDIVDGEQATVETFEQLYNSEEYDALLICGHGEFNIYNPHKSFIELHDQKHLSLEHINRLNYQGERRRLVFLNICDGASASLENSPVAIGLSKAMVQANQTLISHIWPVPSRYSMILNWLFACLLPHNDYLGIFIQMIKISKAGNQHILEFIAQYTQNSEILDRITNTSDDFSNFGNWGSLSYMV